MRRQLQRPTSLTTRRRHRPSERAIRTARTVKAAAQILTKGKLVNVDVLEPLDGRRGRLGRRADIRLARVALVIGGARAPVARIVSTTPIVDDAARTCCQTRSDRWRRSATADRRAALRSAGPGSRPRTGRTDPAARTRRRSRRTACRCSDRCRDRCRGTSTDRRLPTNNATSAATSADAGARTVATLVHRL